VTEPEVVRYSDRPELWDSLGDLSSEVWPEYNLHGDVLNHYWNQLYTTFPGWQFVLFDTAAGQVLAEGHTIPVAWDGTDAGLGPGIDASLAAGFALRAAGGIPSAVCALAAGIPPRHQGRGLSPIMLRAMAGLAADAGLAHLIAPVRPNLKERYPTIAIGRYAAWTRADGTPFDPAKAVQIPETQTRRRRFAGFASAGHSPGSVLDRRGTATVMFGAELQWLVMTSSLRAPVRVDRHARPRGR
jgi:hypothetical protein